MPLSCSSIQAMLRECINTFTPINTFTHRLMLINISTHSLWRLKNSTYTKKKFSYNARKVESWLTIYPSANVACRNKNLWLMCRQNQCAHWRTNKPICQPTNTLAYSRCVDTRHINALCFSISTHEHINAQPCQLYTYRHITHLKPLYKRAG